MYIYTYTHTHIKILVLIASIAILLYFLQKKIYIYIIGGEELSFFDKRLTIHPIIEPISIFVLCVRVQIVRF